MFYCRDLEAVLINNFLFPQIITFSTDRQMFSVSFYLPSFTGSEVSQSLPGASNDDCYRGSSLKYHGPSQNIWGRLFLLYT